MAKAIKKATKMDKEDVRDKKKGVFSKKEEAAEKKPAKKKGK